MTHVNIWAVLVSALASMIIGSIWYGPLFGKKYMQLMGMEQWTPEQQAVMKKKMTGMYILQFIASLVMFYGLAWFMANLRRADVMGGIHTALLAWITFLVPQKFGDSLWGGKMALFWIGIGGSLITVVVGGIILGAWR